MAGSNIDRAETVMGILTLFYEQVLENISIDHSCPKAEMFETKSSLSQECNGLRLVSRLMAMYFQL